MRRRPLVLRDVTALKTFAAAAVAMLLALIVALPSAAEARPAKHWKRAAAAPRAEVATSATDPNKDAALIIDADTGKVLYSRNAYATRHPASLTKMMTLYLLFDAMRKGTISLNSSLAVSAHASVQKPTNLRLQPGDQITVETAIKAIVVRSANDVAVAIAEGIGGTESHFAQMMTQQARDMGMSNTYFHNASGLPDILQVTTASDLAILARRLKTDFPQYYPYFATPGFYYRGVNYVTHDNLLGRYEGTDGIKTGYTQMSGFNLVSSVERSGRHIVGVVMGGRTARKRDKEMMALLDDAFGVQPYQPFVAPTITQPPATVLAANTGVPQPAVPATTTSQIQMAALSSPATIKLTPPVKLPPPPPKLTLFPKPRPAAPKQTVNLRSSAQDADEDSAENMRAPDDDVLLPVVPKPKPIVVAAYKPQKPKQAAKVDLGEGDIGDMPKVINATGKKSWAIQIGAFADATSARTQLSSYAERSMDLLGQVSRIVVPFQGTGGQKLFRARFGPFAEKEARTVCAVLTKRGQTCFAASAN
ncbi:MAG TPA: D-alanyl-D-alanine carboxypeptidase [Rhizomicrobium sp.]|nr:D-alanyl-D-alanine carboxypeptidase [Rhizomicrobium sp.]